MNYTWVAVAASISLFAAILLVSNIARQMGRGRPHLVETSSESAGAVIGAIFALLGLLTAFTFSGAYSRYEARRQLIVQEVNAIGTAYLRLDLLPQEAQSPLRQDFRNYALSRTAFYQKIPNRAAAIAELDKATSLQQDIWTKALAACRAPEYQSARMLLTPALNEMFDIVMTRTVAIQNHPPHLIFYSLAIIALACAGMTGYRSSLSDGSPQFYNFAFALVISFTVCLILDMEYLRYGLIRLDQMNQMLADLALTMK